MRITTDLWQRTREFEQFVAERTVEYFDGKNLIEHLEVGVRAFLLRSRALVRVSLSNAEKVRNSVNDELLNLKPYPTVTLDRRKDELAREGRTIFDFGTGDPRESTPAAIRAAFVRGVPEVSQYPTVAGWPSMRSAAGDYMARRFGVKLDPQREVLPTQGSKEAIFHLPLVFVHAARARRLVVYGTPAYPVFEIGALFAEARTHALELNVANEYLLTPDLVGADRLAETAIVFLNYPHNPTGQTMPAALYAQWVAAREKHGFLLVSDECYADIYFADPPRSLLEFGRRGCLAVHSLSKRSGMTGYRSGFIAGDAELIATYRRFRVGMGVASPDPVQAAAEVAWSDDSHVVERRATFAAKRELLLALFAELGLNVYPGTSTLFLWVEVPAGESDASYAARLLELGIVVSPGSFYGPGQERYIRVALVPPLDACRAAARLWPRSK
ncbi:MAG: succinyldiaminopimelate transaminase [Planctomycetota bacterium]